MATRTRAPAELLLLAGPGAAAEGLDDLGLAAEVRTAADPGELPDLDDRPAVLLLGPEVDPATPPDGLLRSLPEHVAVVALGDAAGAAAGDADRLFLTLPASPGEDALLRALRAGARHSTAVLAARRARDRAHRMGTELRELNRIGMALMSERDPDRLLGMILEQARRLTTSDAGSLYLVEEVDGERRLHFRLAQNDSLPDIPTPDFTLPVDETSIAGFAASTAEALVIEDAYDIPPSAPYSFNRSFDEEYGYRAKSMLVVPMVDHKDEVVGVLQLINRKRDPGAVIRDEASARAHVVPYSERDVELVRSLAGQAAVSIENGRLYQAIERLFEGFIKAAVTAIDQRDPTTSGHSVRVATMTCDIAELVDRVDRGPFRAVRFNREQMRELRYAGLLHDFGKVGVREEVLVKAKKLPPVMFERIEARFDLIRRTLEADFHRRRADYLLRHGRDGFDAFMEELEAEHRRELERLDRFQEAVREANEPRILPEEGAEILQEIRRTHFRDFEGRPVPYITDEEFHFLAIPKGSLDPDERKQIESHVVHTYRFLQQIPWTENLARVADIAYGHHEKLDGSGYPRGARAPEIPIQTRMMTVSDIFDALTASDRPYKRAVPSERALDILRMEAEGGQLDRDVVRLVIESGVYRKILEVDWRKL